MVLDAKLGNAITEKLEIPCIYDKTTQELQRVIRAQLSNLIEEIAESDMHQVRMAPLCSDTANPAAHVFAAPFSTSNDTAICSFRSKAVTCWFGAGQLRALTLTIALQAQVLAG